MQDQDKTGNVFSTERWLVDGTVEVARIGDVISGPKTIISREPLCQVLYLYLLEGSALVRLSDVGTVELSPNDVLVVFPGRVVTVEMTAHSNRLMMLALQGREAVNASLQLGFWDLMRSTERYEGNFMGEIIACFRSSPERGRNPHVLRLVEQLLETVYLRARNGFGNSEIFNAVRTVNRLPLKGLTTESAAAALGVSRTKLNSIFLTGLKMRPGEYISQIVQARAQAMLFWTKMSVAQVAAKMGFSSAPAFATFLRRRTGRTPAAFRQKPIEVRNV